MTRYRDTHAPLYEDDTPRRIKAEQIKEGDTLSVPGGELHDDLSGLMCLITVQSLKRENGRTVVLDKTTQSEVWWRDGESVELQYRPLDV